MSERQKELNERLESGMGSVDDVQKLLGGRRHGVLKRRKLGPSLAGRNAFRTEGVSRKVLT